MNETVKAWQCIGCGKIEAPQTCIGVCQDRKVEFVYAAEHAASLTELTRVRRQAERLKSVVRRLAVTNPRQGGWEHSYRALQAEARAALAAIADDPASG